MTTSYLSVNAADFIDLVHGTLLATSKDQSLPAFTCIEFSIGADGSLAAAATDRYRLHTGTMHSSTPTAQAATALVTRDNIAHMLATLAPYAHTSKSRRSSSKHQQIEFTISNDGPGLREWVITHPSGVIRGDCFTGDFPNWRELLDAMPFGQVSDWTLNARYVADIGKVPSDSEYVYWSAFDPTKGFRATRTHPAITWHLVLMPTRPAPDERDPRPWQRVPHVPAPTA